MQEPTKQFSQVDFSMFSPGRILLFSFLFVIALGTILLALPISRNVDIPLIDLIFTSVSTTCVTGLKVAPISYFTQFGQIVILCLIQIGGLGLMTLSLFFISLILNMDMTTRLMAGEILEFKRWSKVKNFLIIIVTYTFFIELIGAIFLYIPLRNTMSRGQAIFYSIFHSVTSLCNAGITLFDDAKITNNFAPFSLSVIALLVFIGGLGFIVWFEVANKIKSIFKSLKSKKFKFNFSLHTKIVLITSLLLIIFGTLVIWLLEFEKTLTATDFAYGIFDSFFTAVTIRCAGFHVFNLEQVSLATILLFMGLMYIGASPGSTGSGIKTTTFILFLATMVSFIRNRKDVEIFGRTIPQDQVYKAITIVTLSVIWIISLTFTMLVLNPTFNFVQILFEALSAFSTCGLSTGITIYLSKITKILLMITMIIGRIGSLTLVLALRVKKRKPQLYHYPTERISIG